MPRIVDRADKDREPTASHPAQEFHKGYAGRQKLVGKAKQRMPYAAEHSFNPQCVSLQEILPASHGCFAGMILAGKVGWRRHAIQDIFNDGACIVFVRDKTIRQLVVESSTAAFHPSNLDAAFVSTVLAAYAQAAVAIGQVRTAFRTDPVCFLSRKIKKSSSSLYISVYFDIIIITVGPEERDPAKMSSLGFFLFFFNDSILINSATGNQFFLKSFQLVKNS
ncbi:hypothetical protein GXN74_01380 [Clostridiales bacterium F-3ap]|uniref:Uncharacterized protein n=1 Tax=Anaerotalea alkaliphila TaxID=2662126 RepID=A0A7X5HTK6_9FIRM|nr:hypothetical protein [Anaerotalea alkaliphila]NDL66399.1 hypothetical protein [Anaerotalea alkaliphila]